MKEKLINAINQNRDEIINCGRYILNNPEMGYKEFKTSKRVQEEFEKLGIPYKADLAITGVKGTIGKEDAKINICIIGEMDAIKCYENPYANSETGAAHACGHNAQIAAMIGAAYGIVKSGLMDKIDGKITFFAVPSDSVTLGGSSTLGAGSSRLTGTPVIIFSSSTAIRESIASREVSSAASHMRMRVISAITRLTELDFCIAKRASSISLQ